jgi:phosphohistidine phosphatase
MILLVVRHAIAEDHSAALPDELRPLTKEGRAKMRKAALGLVEEVPELDALGTSPLERAKQTAEILRKAYGKKVDAESLKGLLPDARPDEILPWLKKQRGTAAIVGHEPHLSRTVGYLLSGHEDGFLDLRKGGACLLEFTEEPRPGGAQLLWHMKPSQLKRLA